jgi:hypothetical protein
VRKDCAAHTSGSRAIGQSRTRAAPGKGGEVATPERRYGPGAGITLGGIIVVVGILVLLFWSTILGIILILVGLLAFGGFARGRWY